MNLKNRIRRMEKEIIPENSEFCECETEFTTVVLIPTMDGGKMTLDGKPYEEPPEFCETCAKPNADSLYVSFAINPDIELTGEI